MASTSPRPEMVEISREYAHVLDRAVEVQSPLRSAGFILDGQKYCSRSEAACARLMEKYLRGFEMRNGITYQVPLGRAEDGQLQCADFYVRGVLFEYHPPRFWQSGNRSGDFDNAKEYIEYLKNRREMERAERKEFKEVTLRDLTERYTQTRQALINRSRTMMGTELVVATDPEDFYKKIICRFCKNPPPLTKFLHEFKVLRSAAEEIKKREAA